MKIAVLSCFYPYRGGISQFNTCLLNELSKGHTVKAFNFKRQYPNFLFPGKTQFVTEDDNAVPVESEALLDTANPFSYIATAKRIREWNPDLLIMRYWMSYFGPSLGYVASHMNKNTKVISILDNVIPHEQRFFDSAFTKYFLKPHDGFVVLCDAVKDDLLSFNPNAKYINTPHPLYSHFGNKLKKEEAEDILGIKRGKKNILFFGLIRDYKGLDILLRTFGKLDNSYQLIIAGEPYGNFDKYQQIINNLPNRDNIYLNTNYIKDNQVSRYFSAADVCVLPYRSATQSGISSISYHFEIPMITTNVGGLKEAIGNTGTGIVVDYPDSKLIEDAIINYFDPNNISQREAMIKRIKEEKERLSWSNFSNKLLDFYKEIKK